MSKFNKNKHIDKNLLYETEYYKDLEECYVIKKLSNYLDKLPFKNQLVNIFLKCFPPLRTYKSNGFLNNPKQNVELMFLDRCNQIILLFETNSNLVISFFTITNEENKIIISNVCTNPLKTKKGFMKQLLKYYIKMVPNIIELEVYEENPAVTLYESLGFKFVNYIDNDRIEDYWEDGMYSKKCIYRYN